MENACYILKEYLNYHNENIEKYGENTVVLMQVGNFYEIYAVINDEIHVGDDLNKLVGNGHINFSRVKMRLKKKITEISYDNYLMTDGFALPSFWEYYFNKIFGDNNYTVVLVKQEEPPNPERQITNISI